MKIKIYDTTLRDGAQGAGVSFSPEDKLNIIRALDRLGISYIEAGMVTDEAGKEFFRSLGELELENAKLSVFTPTVHPGVRAEDSEILRDSAAAPVPVAAVFGKSSLYHVKDVLRTTPGENIRMIKDSVRFLRDAGKEVIFDAEHFFDGYSDNPSYALEVLAAASEAGASTLVLCDTNGGMLPDVVGMATERVCREFPSVGIHAHNDLGMAVSCSVSAVLSGAVHVQGTVSGIGERCGNANLNTLIPLLQLKLGFDCVRDNIKRITPTAKYVNEIANLTFDESEPFVGAYAFTHKAGAHIDGIRKDPRSFEHVDPASVGNLRNTVISELSGRAAVTDKIGALSPLAGLDKDDPRVAEAVKILREREKLGYVYEQAEGSLSLIVDGIAGERVSHFDLLAFKVIAEDAADTPDGDELMKSSAMIKIAVGGSEEIAAAEGNGPVNAMDRALRRALTRFYPEVGGMKLTDYRVRVIDSGATAAAVRVLIESTDGVTVWRTVGVSTDIINASWQALRDSVEYMLSHVTKSDPAPNTEV